MAGLDYSTYTQKDKEAAYSAASRTFNRYPNYPYKLFNSWRGVSDLLVTTSKDTTGTLDGVSDLGGYWYEALVETALLYPNTLSQPKLYLVAAHRRLTGNLKGLLRLCNIPVSQWQNHKSAKLHKALNAVVEDYVDAEQDLNSPYLMHRDINVETFLKH